MDGRRFDAITVLLTMHRSRRATLKMVAGSIGSGIIAVPPTRALAGPKTKTLVCKAKENPINPSFDNKFECVIECPASTDSCFLCTMDETSFVSCSGFCCTAGIDCPGDPDEGASFNANTKKEAKALCAKAAVKGIAKKATEE
jgi:hypothetical protein